VGLDIDLPAHSRHLVDIYVPFGADWFRYWMRRVAESREPSNDEVTED
jgi:proline dehydrogenase